MELPPHTPSESRPDCAASSGPNDAEDERQPIDGEERDCDAGGTPSPWAGNLQRFCPGCGTAWDVAWTECPACTERERRRRAVATRPDSPGHPLRSALGLYFVLLSTTAIGIVIDTAISNPDSEALNPRVWLGIDVADAIIVLLWCVGSWPSIRSGLVRFASPRWYAVAAAIPIATFLLAGVGVWLLVEALGIEEIRYSEPFLSAGFGWWVVILAICVQPAVIEELAFRGVMLAALQHILNVREAVIVSALLFMVIHLAVLSFPHLFVIGLVLGYLRVKTGSIYPCMLAHFVHNLLVVLSEHL